MEKKYDHTVSDFEQSTAAQRKHLKKTAAKKIEEENNLRIIHSLGLDKNAITTTDDVRNITDDHVEDITDAWDEWKEAA